MVSPSRSARLLAAQDPCRLLNAILIRSKVFLVMLLVRRRRLLTVMTMEKPEPGIICFEPKDCEAL